MKWHFFHRWSPWGKPFEVKYRLMQGVIPLGDGIERRQGRTCTICGAVQERTVSE